MNGRLSLTKKFASRAVLAISAIAIIEASPLPIMTQEASAQNLLQAIFGGNQRKKKREAARIKREAELLKKQQASVVKRAPRIKGPSYKTYKADKLVTAKLSSLTDPVTTGAVKPAASAIATGVVAVVVQADPFTQGFDALSSMKLKVLPEVEKALLANYSKAPRHRWVDENGVTAQAKAIIAVLNNADEIGLESSAYAVQMPQLSVIGDEDNKWSTLMQFEIELSAALLTYAIDANRGLIDPNKISDYHDFKRKDLDLSTVLVEMTYAGDPAKRLSTYSPQGGHFKALKDELVTLRQVDEKVRITIADGTFLKPGQKSAELRNIIAGIRDKGSDELKSELAFEINTYRGEEEYSPNLVKLVKAFQKENNLSADGIVGKKTIRAMVDDSNEVKIEKIRYAMERARWLPGKLADKRVFINQPAYRVTYYENNKANLSMRVVVGKKANQTNFFDNEIEKVEFNPTWGVPQSIITNEMLPKLRADPSYLDRIGYKVSYNGKATSSSSINWSALGSTRAIGVRQPAGPKNALGQLKILFPNKHAIYMHDTPAKSLFSRDTRAFSHGCVRLHDPKAMAAAVLGTDVDQVNGYIAPRKTKTVFLETPIPVHVAYFTAWPSETGAVEYFDDVYGRDKALSKAFEATMKTRAASNS
jgi:murein L,D-transpeptidase YcbB/YkuD